MDALRWVAAIVVAVLSGFASLNLFSTGIFAAFAGSAVPTAVWWAGIPVVFALALVLWALLLPRARWWGVAAVLISHVGWFATSGGFFLLLP